MLGSIWVALRLSSLPFFTDEDFEVDLGFEEVVYFTGGDRFKEFDAIFFFNVQAGFFVPELVAVAAVVGVSLSYFGNIGVVDGPEFLGFVGGEVESLGDESRFIGFEHRSFRAVLRLRG